MKKEYSFTDLFDMSLNSGKYFFTSLGISKDRALEIGKITDDLIAAIHKKIEKDGGVDLRLIFSSLEVVCKLEAKNIQEFFYITHFISMALGLSGMFDPKNIKNLGEETPDSNDDFDSILKRLGIDPSNSNEN